MNNLPITLYTSTNVLRNSWCSQKAFLKISQISCFSGSCRIFKNTFLLEHSWVSASDFIFDIFKSNKYMKVSFLLIVFYRKK